MFPPRPRTSRPGAASDQIRWYDSHSLHNQHWFKALKLVQILVAAAIPVAAGLEAPMWLVGRAGALIVALEGVQQLQQYQQNWTTYRSTAEQLKLKSSSSSLAPARERRAAAGAARRAGRGPGLPGARRLGLASGGRDAGGDGH